MNHCKDCKHWMCDGDAPDGWRQCDMVFRDGTGRPKHQLSLAKAGAGDLYCGSYLDTAPDFGCVQWEAK